MIGNATLTDGVTDHWRGMLRLVSRGQRRRVALRVLDQLGDPIKGAADARKQFVAATVARMRDDNPFGPLIRDGKQGSAQAHLRDMRRPQADPGHAASRGGYGDAAEDINEIGENIESWDAALKDCTQRR